MSWENPQFVSSGWAHHGRQERHHLSAENLSYRKPVSGVQPLFERRPLVDGRKTEASFGESIPLGLLSPLGSASFIDSSASQSTKASATPSYDSQPLLEDNSILETPTWGRSKSRSPEWRKTLYGVAVLAGLVLILNIIWAVVAVTKYPLEHGLRRLYRGQCTTAARIDLVLHIAINILSTILLSSSNYTMQCLNAPTRDDVDKAHKQEKWLSVGLTNIRNLAWIPRRRAVLFCLLFVTAWPLHFVWNSIVFSSSQANMYSALIVTSDFVSSNTFDNNLGNLHSSGGVTTFNGFNFSTFHGARKNISIGQTNSSCFQESPSYFNFTGASVDTGFSDPSFLSFAENLYQKSRNNSMKYLDREACIQEYSSNFLAGQRNLLVVVNSTIGFPPGQVASNGSMLAFLDSHNWDEDLSTNSGAHWNPSAWMCSTVNDSAAIIINDQSISISPIPGVNNTYYTCGIDLTCDVSKVLDNAQKYNNWTVASQIQNQTYAVDHCLSEMVQEVCEVQFALSLMIAVLACNLIKLVCMVLAIRSFPKPPLVVLGDAITSFLNKRDPMTAGLCLTVGPSSELVSFTEGTEIQRAKRRKWSNKSKLWSDVARGNWMLALILALGAIGFGIAMLYKGSTNLGLQSLGSLPFGGVSPSTLILFYAQSGNPSSQSQWFLLHMVLVANSPQILFSMLYFLYNRSYTAMVSMVEWTSFLVKRQSLRVSNPTGLQRSTYWLQLPYSYSIPLLISSGLIHWVLSQALFLVRISFYDRDGQPTFPAGPSSSFTPTSNTLTVPGYSPKAILVVLVITILMLAVLIGNEFRRYPSAMPLVVSSSFAISAACHQPEGDLDAAYERVKWGAVTHPDRRVPGHCCFTSYAVEPPIVGRHYE